jgi:hypothetical protein
MDLYVDEENAATVTGLKELSWFMYTCECIVQSGRIEEAISRWCWSIKWRQT